MDIDLPIQKAWGFYTNPVVNEFSVTKIEAEKIWWENIQSHLA